MTEKRISALQRLSSMANWRLPSGRGWSSFEFDPYPSLGSALPLTWADPFILCLAPFHIAAYYWFVSVLVLSVDALCTTPLHVLGRLALAGWMLQLVWAAKAVYLMDKAAPTPSFAAGFVWRTLRTSVLGLPFSFAPAWVIGCLFWPLLRIPLRGGTHFYDFSLLIGQYVQNSIWYVGARQGSLGGNFEAFSIITTSNRSRYWDTAAEQGQINASLGGLVYFAFGIVLAVIGNADPSHPLALGPLGAVPLTSAIAMGICLLFGLICMFINTTGLGAISLLEYAKHEAVAPSETPLPVDARSRWLLYLPHAFAGVAVYCGFAALLVDSFGFTCNLPLP